MFRKKIIGPPGPTGTSYYAWLAKNGRDDMYKMTDRSLYGARPPFAKVFAKEEKLDGMSEDELAKRVGMTLMDNSTDCNCGAFETEIECEDSGIGCIWHPLFESCHPPELIDGSYLESYFKLYLCISDVPRSQYILSPSAISQTTKTKKLFLPLCSSSFCPILLCPQIMNSSIITIFVTVEGSSFIPLSTLDPINILLVCP